MSYIALLLLPILVQARVPVIPRSTVSAKGCGEAQAKKVDFSPALDGLLSLNKPLDILASAVKLTSSSKKECSGSFVSDQGHILTSSHCLEDCVLDGEGRTSGGDGQSPVRCRVKVNGAWNQVSVVSTNTCRMQQRLEAMYEGRVETPLAGCDDTDLALILPIKPLDFLCNPLAEQAPTGTDHLTALGFPSETNRRGPTDLKARDSDGNQIYVSEGYANKSNTCTDSSDFGSVERPLNPTSAKLRDHFGSLQTTVDFVGGSSGGPLLNPLGEVVGVAFYYASDFHGPLKECRGATFFQPVHEWRRILRARDPGIDLSQFKCEQKRVLY